MKPKREIEKCLQSALIKRGWRYERVEDLRRVFVKSEILTPFFWPAVTGRSAGWYSMDGYVGILDREFEAIWRTSHTSRNCFPVMMHIANFAEFRTHTVKPPEITSGVEQFAVSLESFVSRWPRNRAELRQAFAEKKLLGKDIESFGFIAATLEGAELSPKFSEFRSFLERPH